MTRYRVDYVGRYDPHRIIFDGPDARSRAVRYARERGSSAIVTEPDTGEIIWRFQDQRGSDDSSRHYASASD